MRIRVCKRRIIIFEEVSNLLEFGRRVEKFGRRQQVAKRNTRVERSDRHFEVAPATLIVSTNQVAGSRSRLRADQQCSQVGGGNFNAAEHKLRNENRPVDNDHRRSVGQGDHEVSTNDTDVGQFDAGRKGHDAVAAGNHTSRVGRELGQIADVDHQPRIIGRTGRVSQRVMKDVGDTRGGAGVAIVAVVAASIDRKRAVLALH